MEFAGRVYALIGRFAPGGRAHLADALTQAGAQVLKRLSPRADAAVVGAASASLILDGRLPLLLAQAEAGGMPVYSEAMVLDQLAGAPAPQTHAPLAAVLRDGPLDAFDCRILAALGLITIDEDAVSFADAARIKTAIALAENDLDLAEIARAMAAAPQGKRLVPGPAGRAALAFPDGLADLQGQGLLPLGAEPPITAYFDAAQEAADLGDYDLAARLFEICTRAGPRDPCAPFNLANAHLERGAFAEAILAYQIALARAPNFIEAYYNLAQAYEARGDLARAKAALEAALKIDPRYADAIFNLGQIELALGAPERARALYERYLFADPPPEWAAKARRLLKLCAATAG